MSEILLPRLHSIILDGGTKKLQKNECSEYEIPGSMSFYLVECQDVLESRRAYLEEPPFELAMVETGNEMIFK